MDIKQKIDELMAERSEVQKRIEKDQDRVKQINKFLRDYDKLLKRAVEVEKPAETNTEP